MAFFITLFSCIFPISNSDANGKAIVIKHPLVSKQCELFHVMLSFWAQFLHFEKKVGL
jgi:hypothetical protein